MTAADIHRVTPANAALLDRVADDVFDHLITPEYLSAYLEAAGHALFVAVEEGLVVGQVRGILHLQPDATTDLYIDNLGVAEGFRRRRIATQLLNALVAWGRTEGCAHVWVATEDDNEGAIAFYRSAGLDQQTLVWFSKAIDRPEAPR